MSDDNTQGGIVISWPFSDLPDTEVFTTVFVMDGSRPVLLVSHDLDDGAWQILCGTTDDPDHGVISTLGELVELDPSLIEVGALPVGWEAWRDGPGETWQINIIPEEDDEL